MPCSTRLTFFALVSQKYVFEEHKQPDVYETKQNSCTHKKHKWHKVIQSKPLLGIMSAFTGKAKTVKDILLMFVVSVLCQNIREHRKKNTKQQKVEKNKKF